MNIRIAPSPIHGRGVFANARIAKGEWHCIYGELRTVLPGDPLERYGVEWNKDKTFMPYAPWCCINHSNDPNCEVSDYDGKYPVKHPLMMIVVMREIRANEELTIDYGYDPSKD